MTAKSSTPEKVTINQENWKVMVCEEVEQFHSDKE
jgi:hypothetical protein